MLFPIEILPAASLFYGQGEPLPFLPKLVAEPFDSTLQNSIRNKVGAMAN